MNKGCVLSILLLSTTMTFAADGGTGTTTGTTTDSTTAAPSADSTTTTTGGTATPPATDTTTTSTTMDGATPTQDNQAGDMTTTNVTDVDNVDVDANVQVVNDRVSITGVTTAPSFVGVDFRDGVYYLPPTITPINGFYFLTIDNTDRVCSVKKVSKVKVLETPTTTVVMRGNKRVTLYCYERRYFTF